MEATTDNFRTLFPEFDDTVLTDAQVELYLEQAREIHACSGTAQLYLAAHLAAMDLADGAGEAPGDINTSGEGFATQQKVGDLSVTYAKPRAGDEEFMRTKYGRKFTQFRDASLKKLTLRVCG